ncbi:TPA: HAD-IIA family hydrolase [bacterium]|nr:HAD-IIA family hydrolase [bacterium]
MKSYKGYIFDMDGVIYRGDEIIYEAVEAINTLVKNGHKVMFVTNNSGKLAVEYAKVVKNMGIIGIGENDILTSGNVASIYLKKQLAQNPDRKNILCVCGNAVKTLMKEIGMNIIDPKDYKNAHYVIVGITTDFNWELGDHAANAIAVYGAEFIGTNPDVAKPAENGEIFAGTGSIIAFIETASQTKATIMGKPYPEIYKSALERMKLDIKETLMVGDLLNTDIKGANELGMDSAFVLTGLHKKDDIQRFDIHPTYVIENLLDLLK